MAVEVNVEIKNEFEVRANLETAYALFADVPRSIGHFPDVENLIDRNDNVYEWVMKSKGPKDANTRFDTPASTLPTTQTKPSFGHP